MTELEAFTTEFENWIFKRGLEEIEIKYNRPDNPNLFSIWLQSHLDRLRIQSVEFKMVNGELVTENIIYYPEYLGECIFPYEITFKGELGGALDSHHNICGLKLRA